MRAAVFDFDGVIMDSEGIHFRALRDALAERDLSIDETEYQERLLAYDDRTSIRLVLEARGRAFDAKLVDGLAQRKARLFEEARRQIQAFPGVRELIEALAREMPLGIASGALHAEISELLEAAGLAPYFSVVVGADDVTHTKPHPEPYHRAVHLLAQRVPGLRAEECVAFEDTVAGIASARAAGLKVVAITNTYPAAKLQSAHRVVTSLASLAPSDLLDLFEDGSVAETDIAVARRTD